MTAHPFEENPFHLTLPPAESPSLVEIARRRALIEELDRLRDEVGVIHLTLEELLVEDDDERG